MNWKFSSLLALSLIVAVGCQTRLSDNRSIHFDNPGEIDALIIDGIGTERTIKVKATANNGIDVHVFLEENQAEAERMITLGKDTDLVLAKSTGATSVDISATAPAGKATVIMITSTKADTTVDLSMTD